MGELASDVAAADDNHFARELVDAHDALVGAVIHPGVCDEARDMRAGACSDDDVVGCDVDGFLADASANSAGADERCVAVVDIDIGSFVPAAVCLAAVGNLVDSLGENAILDLLEINGVEGAVHTQAAGLADVAGGISGQNEHLGGNTPNVEASTAETSFLHQSDTDIVVVRGRNGIAGPCSDNDDVVVAWGSLRRILSGHKHS